MLIIFIFPFYGYPYNYPYYRYYNNYSKKVWKEYGINTITTSVELTKDEMKIVKDYLGIEGKNDYDEI